jgi:hypothetical protein
MLEMTFSGISHNNLKQLAVAMHAYRGVHGALPPPAAYDKQGKPQLSWRVLVLPYIEQQSLFEQFRLDEPWDSEHNLRLLPRMPLIYGRLDRDAARQPYTTFYRVFVGKGTAFEGPQGLRLPDDFPDGEHNTILIVEAAEAVPWTKPEELTYAADRPVPPLGGMFEHGFQAALVDGSVITLKRDTGEAKLRALITRKGGEKLGPDGRK